MKLISAAIAGIMLLGSGSYAEYIVFSGKTLPNKRVSFMIGTSDIDFSDIDRTKIVAAEVITADSEGNFKKGFDLDTVRGADGKIENFKLKSNIETLDINSGTVSVPEKRVFIDGKETALETAPETDEKGNIFVPLVEIFGNLGTTLEKNGDKYEGKANNGEIIIEIGKDTAEVDWVDLELPAKSYYNAEGKAMVPLYLIEDALKTDAPEYDKDKNIIYLKSPNKEDSYEEDFDIEKVIKTLPEGTTLMSGDSCFNNWYAGSGAEYQSFEIVDASADGFSKKAVITTKEYKYGETPAPGDVQRARPITGTIPKGEVAVLSFKARATQTTDETGKAMVTVVLERTTDWQKGIEEEITINHGDWQQFYFPVYNAYYDFPSSGDYASRIMFKIGAKPQTFELADLKLVTYGNSVDINILKPDMSKPYKGMGEDALWRKEAFKRIGKYRKGNASVLVTDSSGNPLKDAEITVKQTESDFMFGVAICENEIIGIDKSTATGKIQNDVVNNLFNTAVCGLEMKTPYMADDDGDAAVRMADEFFSRGKRMRGHCLLWDNPGLLPLPDYETMSYDEIRREVLSHTLPEVYMFKGRIAQWDVLNEPSFNTFTRTKFGTTRLYSDLFKAVKKVDPEAKLFVNETGIEGLKNKTQWSIVPSFVELVKKMKAEGAPIDGIGIQAHCTNYYYPMGIYHQIDECSKVVDEVAITEYDFRNVNEDYADEHMRDTLIAAFSHPKTTSFTVWGYQDTMHWRGCAPFYDREWNEKPAKAVWDNYVNNVFKTNLTLKTDENGRADFRGFYGDYEISVKYGGAEKTALFSLEKDKENSVKFRTGANGINSWASNVPGDYIPAVQYKTLDEARQALYEDMPQLFENFESVLLESDFCDIMLDEKVSNGAPYEENGAYLKGEGWASSSGIASFAENSRYGIVLKDLPAENADLSRRFSEKVYPDGNIELSLAFKTYSSGGGNFETSFNLTYGDEECPLLNISASEKGYEAATPKGGKINIPGNSECEIFVKLFKNENAEGYSAEYRLDLNGETAETLTEDYPYLEDLTALDGESIYFSSAGGSGSEVLRLKNTRVIYKNGKEIIEFENADYPSVILDESMRNFDVSSLGSSSSEEYKNGGAWAKSSYDSEAAFEYRNNMHYLWGIRGEALGEQRLSRKFASPADGENLSLEFDFYINAQKELYSSPCYFGISLGSSDKSVSRVIARLNASTSAFKRQLLADSSGTYAENVSVPSWDSNDINRNDTHISLKLEKNADGGYNAELTVLSEYGKKDVYTAENYLTAAEFEKLDMIFISSRTLKDSAKKDKGLNMAGIKNIVINKYGMNAEKNSDGLPVFKDGATVSVPFKNISGKDFGADITVGAYKNDMLLSADKFSFDISGKKIGTLTFRLNSKEDAESYKIFMFSDFDNLVPKKESESLIIQRDNQ